MLLSVTSLSLPRGKRWVLQRAQEGHQTALLRRAADSSPFRLLRGRFSRCHPHARDGDQGGDLAVLLAFRHSWHSHMQVTGNGTPLYAVTACL